MKLLHKAPNSIVRDALVNDLKNFGIQAFSPESFEFTSINYGGLSAIENKYSVFVHEEDFEKGQEVLEKFLKK